MKITLHILVASVIAAANLAPVALHAQATTSAAARTLAEGEVRKVDRESGKITLKHGEIKDLDMPAMTMVFQVSDTAMLDKVKPGDKVRFAATNEGGKLTLTAIQAAK